MAQDQTKGTAKAGVAPASGLARVGRAFRHPAFRYFFIGQLISLTGTWVQTVAQSWLVYRLTGSPLMLGTVVFINQLPMLVLAPLAGALADRLPKRRLIVLTQALQMMLAASLAAITLGDQVSVAAILVLAGLSGLVQAVDVPARQAFVVEMVGKEDLPNAIALNSSLFNGARLIGPTIGGLMVVALGEGWCFALNAGSFAAVILSLLLMPLAARPPVARQARGLAAIREGFAYAWGEPRVRRLLALVGWTSLLGMPYTTLLPVYADLKHGGGPATLGSLMAAAGAGALAAALVLAAYGRAPRFRVTAGAALCFGLALSGFALIDFYPLALAALALAGFAMMTEVGSANIILQTLVPDELRGRVMALYAMMFLGMGPFGGLLIGLAAETFGIVPTTIGGGLLCSLAGVIVLTGGKRPSVL